jgi:predicted nucleotidyltransferase
MSCNFFALSSALIIQKSNHISGEKLLPDEPEANKVKEYNERSIFLKRKPSAFKVKPLLSNYPTQIPNHIYFQKIASCGKNTLNKIKLHIIFSSPERNNLLRQYIYYILLNICESSQSVMSVAGAPYVQ